MSQNRTSIKDIVLAWKAQQPGRSVPIPNKSEPDIRIDAYLDLFETLLSEGYSKEEVVGGQSRSSVIHHSHNPNHRDHRKGKIWKDLAEEDFDQAVAMHPQLCVPVEVKKFDRSKANYKVPEAREFQKNIEELKQSIAQDESTAPVVTKAPAVAKKKEYADPYFVSPEDIDQFKKEMESTEAPESKKDHEKPVYDPEMRKILGYDDE